MMNDRILTYTELIKLKTFKERFNYLKLNNKVCEETFGFNRYLNQKFYKSSEWKHIRDYVITRDNGCDLGVIGHEIISEKILIHHMNPITIDDIIHKTKYLLNPEYLITTIYPTHNAIHYGSEDLLFTNELIERKPNDTCPWK